MKMFITESRICEICKSQYNRKPGHSIKQYNVQRTCSSKCRYILLKNIKPGFKKGHPVYSEKGRFAKGQVPHNKGQKGIQIPWNKGKKGQVPWNKDQTGIYSEETRSKIREARAKQVMPTGENHWLWKGGLSSLRKLLMQTYIYKQWRASVFKRDDYTCQICKQRGGTLHADHIKSYASIIEEYKITTVEEAKKCLDLWDISNGRTLCIGCHMATGNYGGKSISKLKT